MKYLFCCVITLISIEMLAVDSPILLTADLPDSYEENGKAFSVKFTVHNTTNSVIVLNQFSTHIGEQINSSQSFNYTHSPGRLRSAQQDNFNVLLPRVKRNLYADIMLQPGQHLIVAGLLYSIHSDAHLSEHFTEIHPHTPLEQLKHPYPLPRYSDKSNYHVFKASDDAKQLTNEVNYQKTIQVVAHKIINNLRNRFKIGGFRTDLAYFGTAIDVDKDTKLYNEGNITSIGIVTLDALEIMSHIFPGKIEIYLHFSERCLASGLFDIKEPDPTQPPMQAAMMFPVEELPYIELTLNDLSSLWQCIRQDNLTLLSENAYLVITKFPDQ